ncbi:hypothetical protein, partial [Niveispirillum irakense]|uniref:hypothetical protein n=2 Tax=Niveispirillum irakense TaxID=34011 RepID=UPI001AEC1314
LLSIDSLVQEPGPKADNPSPRSPSEDRNRHPQKQEDLAVAIPIQRITAKLRDCETIARQLVAAASVERFLANPNQPVNQFFSSVRFFIQQQPNRQTQANQNPANHPAKSPAPRPKSRHQQPDRGNSQFHLSEEQNPSKNQPRNSISTRPIVRGEVFIALVGRSRNINLRQLPQK